MSFGGFTSNSSGRVSEASGGGKMVADGLCSYNIMLTGAMSQTLQMVQSSYSKPLFSTPPLSLALVCTLLSLSLSVVCVSENQILLKDLVLLYFKCL